jgi:hypothetical protein
MIKSKQETKNCSDSCSCKNEKKETVEIREKVKKEVASEQEKKLDPTHFGDWQVNCRAIDF